MREFNEIFDFVCENRIPYTFKRYTTGTSMYIYNKDAYIERYFYNADISIPYIEISERIMDCYIIRYYSESYECSLNENVNIEELKMIIQKLQETDDLDSIIDELQESRKTWLDVLKDMKG